MNDKTRDQIREAVTAAYWMEMETIMNYVANSTNLDGVRAEEIKKAMALDVPAELGHAQTLARRLKEIGGVVPGSKAFTAAQDVPDAAGREEPARSVCRVLRQDHG